ncbi:reverse transcriptase [Moniliophthora roreri]|nr:reverse transcriptase [Moniliophthora roreri]
MKLLEKIIAHSLTFRAGQLGLVLDTQFGGRAHSSAEDAVLTFNHGKVVSALTFDIKGYFDFVNHDRLLAKLQEHGIPLEEVKWVASFLSDREAAVCLDRMQGSMKPVKNGIPQGLPVSPILASFYLAKLLNILKKESVSPPTGCKANVLTMFMYVDDSKIFIASTSIHFNCQVLEWAYYGVESWL